MKRYLLITTGSVFLILLSIWLVSFGLDQRRVDYDDIALEKVDIDRLSRLPGVLYGSGMRAWAELDAGRAAALFRQVVIRDPLFMDAWLKLAEAEKDAGNENLARRITAFCDTKISQVLRWKQSHTLLAHELAMQDIFRHNLNYLVARRKRLSDIFYLLDAHTMFETDQALALLARENRGAYLAWLMKWKRVNAAQTTWEAVEADGMVTDELLLDYVHFLVSQKEVASAALLWRRYTGLHGMTNAGFEDKIMNRGFGWRILTDKDGKNWQGYRVYGYSLKGTNALYVSFFGKENVDWRHIYQIVPVTPEQSYLLMYWWKSKGVSTDQKPFVEIFSYDTQGLYQKGPMALRSHDWIPVTIAFTPPANCHAVVVRLRRKESLRFDNKIQGALWLDEFALTLQEPVDSRSGVARDSL